MLKVLIVEDDLLIADMVEDVLIGHGYKVCGMARTVTEAVALCRRHKPDLALVDLRLADEGLGTQIAAQLGPDERPGILYATGNTSQFLLTTADGDACLAKPYGPDELIRGMEIVTDLVSKGKTSRVFPGGFQVLLPQPSYADATDE